MEVDNPSVRPWILPGRRWGNVRPMVLPGLVAVGSAHGIAGALTARPPS